MGAHTGVKSDSGRKYIRGKLGIDNMDIYDVEPFLVLLAVRDLRPLVREPLAAGSYPLTLARLAARIAPWKKWV